MILKPWSEDMDFMQDEIKTIPIWMQVSVDFKYWGIRSLEKILKPVGGLLRLDAITTRRERLQYARCMVEVKLNQDFPDHVEFKDEKGNRRRAIMHYEWKPTLCSNCQKVGHSLQECYHKKETKKSQKQWVKKIPEVNQVQERNDMEVTSRVDPPTEPHSSRGTSEATKVKADDMVPAKTSQYMEGKGSKQAQILVTKEESQVQRGSGRDPTIPYG
ncbi:putative shell protein 2 [Bienertia sinuspersici]